VADLNVLTGNSPTADPSRDRRKPGLLFYIGAGGLLLATIVEAVAVAGRQLGVPLLGALEIIQAAILLTSSSAMLSATLSDNHAAVRLLVERLPARVQAWQRRLAMLVSAVFFAALAVAVCWLTIESWNDFEESELLHIPYRPLRVIASVMTIAIAVVFLAKCLRRVPREPRP
jgi:TRAP-type C4-dicarboxylate transport system permease small subunit